MSLRFFLLAVICFATVAARAQGVVDRIRARGELVISTDATYPPFETMKDEEIQGFDVDVANALAAALKVKVRWINQEWAGVLGSLESGKADLVMAGTTITEERKGKGYVFSRPYFLSGQAIARRKGDSRIEGPETLKDKIVSVQQETTGQFAVDKIGVPKDRQLRFDTVQDGLADVVNKRSDACVGDLPTIQAILREGYPEIEIVGPVFVKENLGIIAWKGNEELISQVNRVLARMLVDGSYKKAYDKWVGVPFTSADVAELEAQKDAGTKVPVATEDATSQPIQAVLADRGSSAFAFRGDLFRQALPLLAKGAVLTLELTGLSLVFGVAGGLILALGRLSPLPFFRPFIVAYVEVVRGTPLLMQIYVIYFVLPAIGINLPSFVAGVLALSLNAAAYSSEIFRGGIESIDSGQMEAARSLGMSHRLAMRWVILPQTIRRVLPPLTNEAVALLK
ncbi:transporter substrate-binding domain-containing protein, partial [bacterium]